MTNLRKAVLTSAIFLVGSVSLALAQGTYAQIDVPGAVSTAALGIDTAGDIVGSYQDSANNYHGFLLSGGLYTTIDYPGQGDNSANGINDRGQIVGQYNAQFSGDPSDGFVYEISSQTFKNIVIRNGLQTAANAISNTGVIVGFAELDNGTFEYSVGFDLAAGVITKILPPGFDSSYLGGISPSGRAVGIASSETGSSRNFLLVNGVVRFIRIPAPDAGARGINDAGSIVGSYDTYPNEKGFIYQDGSFQSIIFPGSLETGPSAINNAGTVVGAFSDTSGLIHGFTWTPPAEAEKK